MIDFHTHILPDFDDGAKNLDESLKLIELLQNQGVDSIVLTPHFYTHKISFDQFLVKRKAAYENFMKDMQSVNMNFTLACEAYLTDYLVNYEDLTPLCIGNSSFILVELPYEKSFSSKLERMIYKLVSNHNVIPIIAHAERYPFIQKDPTLLSELINESFLIQMNTNSIIDRTSRKFCLTLIEHGLIHFIGTDCHSPDSRMPHIADALTIITNSLGQQTADRLLNNAKNVINTNTIEKVRPTPLGRRLGKWV